MTDAITRRELARRSARWLCGAAIGAWLMSVGARRGDARTATAVCPHCPSLTSCGLPAGLLARETLDTRERRPVRDAAELCKEPEPRE